MCYGQGWCGSGGPDAWGKRKTSRAGTLVADGPAMSRCPLRTPGVKRPADHISGGQRVRWQRQLGCVQPVCAHPPHTHANPSIHPSLGQVWECSHYSIAGSMHACAMHRGVGIDSGHMGWAAGMSSSSDHARGRAALQGATKGCGMWDVGADAPTFLPAWERGPWPDGLRASLERALHAASQASGAHATGAATAGPRSVLQTCGRNHAVVAGLGTISR